MGQYYNASDVLAFTGTDEGFGFPLIEAMACGLPIVGNHCTTVPEIIGDAGILIDNPYDHIALRNALNDTINQRDDYVRLIKKRYSLFDKELFKSKMGIVYDSVHN